MVDGAGLHARTWGAGERTALLLHGQFGSGATWWQIAPRIADQGYRVIAVDLPGHGESPPDVVASLDSCVQQVIAACPTAELAMGHSLGSLVLAHCAHRIGVQRAIYIDCPFGYEMHVNGE